jgi:hypothetical protein
MKGRAFEIPMFGFWGEARLALLHLPGESFDTAWTIVTTLLPVPCGSQ